MLSSFRTYLFLLAMIIFAVAAWATEPAPGQTPWDVLNVAVNAKSFEKRHDAILAIGLLEGDSMAVQIAEKALNDPAPEVRAAAATALGQLHSKASIPMLKLALNDKDVPVVLAAANALWWMGDKEGYEVYYEILVGERKSTNGWIAKREEMLRDRKKLAEFGFEQAITFNPYMSIGWEVFKEVSKDDASPVRAAAARILADDPDPHSGDALVKACSDKSWIVRVAALEALARRGDPIFIKNIEALNTDEKDLVRYTAAAATIKLKNVPAPRQPVIE